MKELISIIIPVYNVEKYVDECIKSVINQTYQNIEIILIDDGSKDESGNICDEYGKKDKRIKVIHIDNGGVSKARNIGLDQAKGQYITFIDADDYVEENYIEQLYEQCKIDNVDISITGTTDFKDDNLEIECKSRKYKKIINSETAIKEILNEKFFVSVIWGKMYKKELWNNIRFNLNTKIAEDLEVLYVILKKCNLINVDTTKLLYNYRIRNTSAIQQKYNKHFEKEIDIVDEIREDIKKQYPKIYDYAIKRYIRINLTCILRYYKEKGELQGVEHLINNIKKYKFKKYTKVKFKRKVKITIVVYLGWMLKFIRIKYI